MLLQLKKSNHDLLFYTEILVNALLILILPLCIVLTYRFKQSPILLYFISLFSIIFKITFFIANRFSPEIETIKNFETTLSPIKLLIYTLGTVFILPTFIYFISLKLMEKQNRKWYKILDITVTLLIMIYSIISTVYFLMLLANQNVA